MDRQVSDPAMTGDPGRAVDFRLWPPVAIGAPLLVGWVATTAWGDPVDLGGWRVPVGVALLLFFILWNGWSLWLFGRHRTGLLPGQAAEALIDEGPYRISRNPLYVGLLVLSAGVALLAGSLWALLALPLEWVLLRWGAVLPEERYLSAKFGDSYAEYRSRVRRWV